MGYNLNLARIQVVSKDQREISSWALKDEAGAGEIEKEVG